MRRAKAIAGYPSNHQTRKNNDNAHARRHHINSLMRQNRCETTTTFDLKTLKPTVCLQAAA